jgi:ABC-type polysaccharide/polyol phosphate export permease
VSLLPTRDHSVAATTDIRNTIVDWHLWWFLGIHDIRQRYRRSTLGPFWLTITTGVTIGGMGFISGGLFGTPMRNVLPFLSLGIILWTLISTCVVEGSMVFISAAGYIKQLHRSYFTYVMWSMWRNIIVFGHNFLIFIVVAVVLKVPVGPVSLLALPGFVLLMGNLLWVAVFLGVLSTRFRDIPIIVQSSLSILFFITPIFWNSDQLVGNRRWVADLNPLTHIIDVVRMPLLGTVPPAFSYAVACGSLVVGWMLAFAFFARFRARLSYWL